MRSKKIGKGLAWEVELLVRAQNIHGWNELIIYQGHQRGDSGLRVVTIWDIPVYHHFFIHITVIFVNMLYYYEPHFVDEEKIQRLKCLPRFTMLVSVRSIVKQVVE